MAPEDDAGSPGEDVLVLGHDDVDAHDDELDVASDDDVEPTPDLDGGTDADPQGDADADSDTEVVSDPDLAVDLDADGWPDADADSDIVAVDTDDEIDADISTEADTRGDPDSDPDTDPDTDTDADAGADADVEPDVDGEPTDADLDAEVDAEVGVEPTGPRIALHTNLAQNPEVTADLALVVGRAPTWVDLPTHTPDAEELSLFDCIFVYGDGDELGQNLDTYGDALADYVDSGGRVIMGYGIYEGYDDRLAAWRGLAGSRVLESGYLPIEPPTGGACAGGYRYAQDGVSFIFDRVDELEANCGHTSITQRGVAVFDGTVNGPAGEQVMTAYAADSNVVFVNAEIGADGSLADGWGHLVANACVVPDRTAIFVDPDARRRGDGFSWESAYDELALAVADAHETGAAIYVKQGTLFAGGALSPPLLFREPLEVFGGMPAGMTGVDVDLDRREPGEYTVLDARHTPDADDGLSTLVLAEAGGVVDGFELTNALQGSAPPLVLRDAHGLQLRNIRIDGNVTESTTPQSLRGGGMRCESSSDIVLENIEISNNTLIAGPGQIDLDAPIDGGEAYGGGAVFDGCSGTADNVMITGNTAIGGSGDRGHDIIVTFESTDGGAAFGGGLALLDSDVTFSDLVVSANTVQGGRGGVPEETATLSHQAGAGADARGGGVYLDGSTTGTWTRVSISSNHALGANGVEGVSTGPTGTTCRTGRVGGDAGSAFGGGLFLAAGAALELAGDVIIANEAVGGLPGIGGLNNSAELCGAERADSGEAGEASGGGVYVLGSFVQGSTAVTGNVPDNVVTP